ncbi:hypothetical protein NE237_024329 [Protea cynaroides]|uniref:RPW8 domain-containing protein n=1 Tax=Protea cynaroides TaxID=273540 RepID=A0A9Q0HGQ7_9MAGN|nr:hypothetical protein NE237_024329 [Protea cynaroides]
MAGELILGAVVGAVAEELSNLILEKKDQAVNFRDHLERLQNSLELMAPLFTEGMQLDLEFNDRQNKGLQKLIAKLRGGEDLIQKCTKVPNWNIYLKMLYSSKIINLDEAILSFCQRELQAEMWRDNKQIMRGVQQFETKLEGQRELQVETWRGVQRLETTVEGLRESQVEIWRDSKQIMRGVQQLETTVEGLSTQLGRSVSLDVFSPGNEGLCAVPELPNCVVGLDVPLRELKIKLFKENVTVLGVCAPGGCGKSTLAAMLCRNEQVQCTFKDKILFLTVSRTPNLKILLRLLEKIGGRLPDSNLSEKDATKQFQYLLQQRKSEPLLLVLDDVWDKSIIEKLFSRTEGYKMLVTSREAFQIYNTEYHSKYLLKTLNHQDSKALFHHTAFFHRTALSQDGNEEFEPDEDLINEILRCCDGFPLAIMVIAKSLSLQPAVIWEKMARKLLKGCSILDFDENLRECLTTSLESLDATVLECFLDLGSFPEDKKVPASALIDMWCELYELEDEDDAYVNLLELASRNLINLVGSR